MEDLKWCFSTNGATFDGGFDSREEVLAEAFACASESAETVDIGRCKPIDFKEIAEHLVGSDAIEDAVYCQISDLIGDCAVDATTRGDLNELADQLVPLMQAWLKKHYGSFYEVSETENIMILRGAK